MNAITLYAVKPRFQAMLRPLVARLAGAGVSANVVTVAAAGGSVLIGAAAGWLSASGWIFLAMPIWQLVRMALNAMDGMLAREFGQQSALGGYLNEIGDVIADAALCAPFALVRPFDTRGIGLVIVLAITSEFAGALGPAVGASRRYDGPMGKSDRALVFGALGLWIGISAPVPDAFVWVMPLVDALLVLTIVNRVRAGLREASAAASPPC